MSRKPHSSHVVKTNPASKPRVPPRLEFTFAEHVAPFEANDLHAIEVQWQSTTGRRVVMKQGMVNLLFERGLQGLACAP